MQEIYFKRTLWDMLVLENNPLWLGSVNVLRHTLLPFVIELSLVILFSIY